MKNVSLRAHTPAEARRIFAAQMEVRAKESGTGSTRWELTGYVSVYDTPYDMRDEFGDYEEQVRMGAGSKTLSESPDVVLVFAHGGMPMARTRAGNLTLSEDSTGLHVHAPSLNGDQTHVRDMVAGIQDGVLTEMSFAFRVIRQQWLPDWMQRDIVEYSLHRGDVSVVTYGANPATSVALRSNDLFRLLSSLEGEDLAEAQRRLARHPQSSMRATMPASLAAAEAEALIAGVRL